MPKLNQLNVQDTVIIEGWGAVTVGELLENRHLLDDSPEVYLAEYDGSVRLSAIDAFFEHLEKIVEDHKLPTTWISFIGTEVVTLEELDEIQKVFDSIMRRSPQVFETWTRTELVDYSELE